MVKYLKLKTSKSVVALFICRVNEEGNWATSPPCACEVSSVVSSQAARVIISGTIKVTRYTMVVFGEAK